jgi:hypothetical protein
MRATWWSPGKGEAAPVVGPGPGSRPERSGGRRSRGRGRNLLVFLEAAVLARLHERAPPNLLPSPT